MSEGISFKELQQFFKYTEQAMKDDKTTIIINNEMCRFLYKYFKEFDSYFNMQDKEIKRLTNNWNELRQYIKEYLEEWENSDDEWIKGKCDMARDILYDMEEIKENNK